MVDTAIRGAGVAGARLAAALLDTGDAFARARPWPHLVLDGAVDPNLAAGAAEDAHAQRIGLATTSWTRGSKMASPVLEGTFLSALGLAIGGPDVTAALSAISGVDDLVHDDGNYAAGLFASGSGDYHLPHHDFVSHPESGLYSRLVLMLYLNDWPADRGGQLQMWPERRHSRPVTIQPRVGRVVLMVVSGAALHGVSKVVCGPNDARVSLAARFYSPQPPVMPRRLPLLGRARGPAA